ncbi:RipA family octameric membrane protein [Actinomycetota bacterium Odt1-20B]
MSPPPEGPQERDRGEILELYKLAVEMADRVSARRGTANAFFLTVQTTFVALIGLGFPKLSASPWWSSLAVALAGLTLSAAWWMQLRSYRDLNTAKFKGIIKMEEGLPVKIFGDEWEELKNDPIPAWRKRYAELGTSERTIPVVFVGAHLLIFVGRLSL